MLWSRPAAGTDVGVRGFLSVGGMEEQARDARPGHPGLFLWGWGHSLGRHKASGVSSAFCPGRTCSQEPCSGLAAPLACGLDLWRLHKVQGQPGREPGGLLEA